MSEVESADAPRKRGRPPKPREVPAPVRPRSEQRQRQARFTVRVLADELARIEAEAERVGMSRSAFARARLLQKSGIRAVRRPPVEAAALSQLLAQVGKIGSNINQIAKQINLHDPVERAEVLGAIADWRAATAAIMQTLGFERER